MCFSIGWFLQLLLFLIIICAVVALVRIWLLPLLAPIDGRLVATINVIIGVVVAIIVIYILFDLISCALGGGVLLRRG